MSAIRNIKAREILDSRGNPTIEVDVELKSRAFGRFAVPSGASTGEHEALELRDQNPRRYAGKGVLKAIKNVHAIIAPKLENFELSDQRSLDQVLLELDGTKNKSKLGANAMLGVSVAAAKAKAADEKKEFFEFLEQKSYLLPTPLMNVINGGAHANNKLSVQEFMIIPVGATTFSEALRHGAEVFYALKEILQKKGHSTGVGDEGGFAPQLSSTREACETLIDAIRLAGFVEGKDLALALDAAASEFFDKNSKSYSLSESANLSAEKLIEFWAKISNDYPIWSIEDPLAENDWEGWQHMTSRLGKKLQIVGDDIFVTNPKLIRQGIEKSAANSVLIKLNQIGTLSETLDAIKIASEAKFSTIISHRSGETEDVTIADLAVGTNAGQIKTGSLSRSDRLAKYNRLLRIEEILGIDAKYAQRLPFLRGGRA